jgi:quercetin dioxygenase-like cupin family protein
MTRRTTLVLIVLGGLLTVIAGIAFGTPSDPLTVDQARGPLVDRPLDVNMNFKDGSKVKLKTKGAIDVAVQRIAVDPGETFGWHRHPGPTIVTVKSGTLTLYHADDCTHGIDYTAGQSFSNLPDEIHLARNNSATQELVIFASYFVPSTTGALRIDVSPAPGLDCPQ